MVDLFSLQIILLASAIVFFAFVVRGLTGFGSGPVMVPLMLLFMDIKIVVPVAAIHAVLTGYLLFFTFKTRQYVRKDLLYVLIPGGIVGVVVGALILAHFKSDVLKILFGLFVIAFSLNDLFFESKKTEATKEAKTYLGLVAGFFGGITGGLFASGGPPLVIYLTRKLKDKNAFRATLVLYFIFHDTWRIFAYGGTGLMSWDILKFSLVLIPAMVLGNLTGSALVQKVNQLLFRRIVAIVLLCIGVTLLIR
jgi:uncharacterized protein